jgi:hypothetical protein
LQVIDFARAQLEGEKKGQNQGMLASALSP